MGIEKNPPGNLASFYHQELKFWLVKKTEIKLNINFVRTHTQPWKNPEDGDTWCLEINVQQIQKNIISILQIQN